MKKVITSTWGKIRLSRVPRSRGTTTSLLIGEEAPEMIEVEVWRRDNPAVVDSHLIRADELEAIGSEGMRQWLLETDQ
jgi:hypothetical protein